ncbi:urea ABC transporter permease subunit UrtB [Megalodesulfovibrio paquesii]
MRFAAKTMPAVLGLLLIGLALNLALNWALNLAGTPLSLVRPAEAAPAGEALIPLLTSDNLEDRDKAVDLLARDDSPQADVLLAALLEGNLYVRKQDGRIVLAQDTGEALAITDPMTGEALGETTKRKLSKVSVNNSLRTRIRSLLAQRTLASPDLDRRREAAAHLLGRLEEIEPETLQARLEVEQDAQVRESLEKVLALKTLETAAGPTAIAAVEKLAGDLNPETRQALVKMHERVANPELRQAIERVQRDIDRKVQLVGFAETLFFGVSLGSVLVLAAIGLAITFGVMGVINMAHGELMMLGAYTTYVVQQLMPQHIGASLFVAVPAAFLVAMLVGVLIERLVIRFLYGRPLETLLATFGVSLVLQQAVRTIFSPLNRSVTTPDWMSGSIMINPVLSLTLNRLYIILFCLLAFAALSLVLKRTRLGLEVRAVSQNRAMARAMGTRASLVDALTFGLGSGIAGVAGVALSQLTNVGPNLGQSYIIDSFMVVVFGGVGNLWGTLVAGLVLGVVDKVMEPLSGAVLSKILVLVGIILFIQKRPRGLFPQRGRAVEN